MLARLRYDGQGHLPDSRVACDATELTDAHRAGCSDASQVVAHQIDDHRVLRAVLLRLREPICARLILFKPTPARGCAFHRPRDEVSAIPMKEEFGRGGEERVPARVEIGAVGGLLPAGELLVERERVAGKLCAQSDGVVDLIGVAARYACTHRRHVALVSLPVGGRLPL